MGVSVREKQKRSGEWWVFISHHGQRKSKKIGSKKQALVIAEEIRAQLAKKELGILKPEAKKIKFGRYAIDWVDGIVKQTKSTGTYTRYSGLLRQKINKRIGQVPIAELSRAHVRDMLLAEGRAGASKSSLGLMLCVVSGAMQNAMDDDLVSSNPTLGISAKLGIEHAQKPEISPLTAEETADVLEIIITTWPELYPFFFTAFRTGMRLGELCGLQWRDIDFDKKQISVSRTAKDQHVRLMTKTKMVRRIDMSNQLAEVLRELMIREQRIHGRLPLHVFVKNGKLMPQATVRRRWNEAVEMAGLPHKRLHDIRHTFASQLLQNGAPVTYVSKQLGHANSHMTLTVYAHYMPDDRRHLINTLDSQ